MTAVISCWLLCNMVNKKTLWVIFKFLINWKLGTALFTRVRQVLGDLNLLLNDICGQFYDKKAIMKNVKKYSFKTWSNTQYVLCLVSLNSLKKMSLLHYWDLLSWIQHFATIISVLFRSIWQMKYFKHACQLTWSPHDKAVQILQQEFKNTNVSELYFQKFEEKTDNKESATCFFLKVDKAQINHYNF